MTSKDFDKNERERNQERLQFRFTVSPKKDQTLEGMSSSKKSMIMPREYPRDKESIEIQTKPSYLSKLLYYTALLQLGLIAGFFALNMYYHFIMLSFAMSLSLMLLSLGLPLIYVIYQQFKPQFNQLEHEAFETIFN